MASGYDMRVGDAEREATAAELREHYASGRLTLEELNERLDKAFAAKTRADLDGLMRDLPSARPRGAGSGSGSGSGWDAGSTGRPGDWTGGRGTGSGAGPGWTGQGSGWGASAGRQAGSSIGAFIGTCVLICALIAVGVLGAFEIPTGRPIGIVLIILAFGLLRRLIFRRRRRVVHGRGPRRRRW
jgi:hypothetical protein